MVQLDSLESFGKTVRRMYEADPKNTRFTLKHRPFTPAHAMFLKVTDGPRTFTYKPKADEPSVHMLFQQILSNMSGCTSDEMHEDIEFDVETLFQEVEEEKKPAKTNGGQNQKKNKKRGKK